jgi:Aldo/keto reductase family
MKQLSRRQFAFCAAVGLSLPTVGAASVIAADAPPRTVKLRNSAIVPVIGQGSARLGQGRHPETNEEEALRTGISLGMSLIDTSGNYGNGRSEKLICRAIAGQRDRVFLVSKVEAAADIAGCSKLKLVCKKPQARGARLGLGQNGHGGDGGCPSPLTMPSRRGFRLCRPAHFGALHRPYADPCSTAAFERAALAPSSSGAAPRGGCR